ncbi:hypothetical protein C6P44_001690 [Monosporozyma unispora]|nr:hypothetical protein C6P44_001690 [Kazachstania unispora]
MVSLRNSAVLAAATLATSNAVTTLSSTDEQAQLLELSVYVQDIAAHMAQYLSFRQQNPNEPYPAILNTVVLKAAGSKDDSWTSELTGIAPSMVERMITGVPWYSTRILPALTARFAQEGVAVQGFDGAAATSAKATSAKATSAKATSAASSKAASSAASSKAASSAASSKATTSASAKAASSSAAKAQAISQITDGQIQATKSIEQQTQNGAAKAVAGLGAGALAAAALLI